MPVITSSILTHPFKAYFEKDERQPEDESEGDEDDGEKKFDLWVGDERNEDEEQGTEEGEYRND